MDTSQFILKKLRQDITENNLRLNAIIQDINDMGTGQLAELQALNSAGRSKIAAIRKSIDKLGDIAKDEKHPELLKEVVLQRELLSTSMDSFKKANLRAMLTIEKNAKEELLRPNEERNVLRNRQKRDKESMVKVSSNVTDQLRIISRQLAETTERSAKTLETLITSSDNVTGTQEELKVTSGSIVQSGKLLSKYGRREFTDKIIMFFAFSFFIACVVYIVQKRLF